MNKTKLEQNLVQKANTIKQIVKSKPQDLTKGKLTAQMIKLKDFKHMNNI